MASTLVTLTHLAQLPPCCPGPARPWLLALLALLGIVGYEYFKATQKRGANMKNKSFLWMIAALLLIMGVACILRPTPPETEQPTAASPEKTPTAAIAPVPEESVVMETETMTATKAVTETEIALPRLLDLGADKCIPCKRLAPILEELKEEYTGHLNVDFIDVWKNPDEGPKYGISQIPTQIFFDAQGKELYRHVGFISKEEILAKWKELGYEFDVK